MEYKGLMGGFYKITEWIMRIAGSNLLWLLCSSPFMIVLAMKLILLLQSPTPQPETLTIWVMGVLAPFTLFPATAALFSVTRKWVMGESDLSIIKVYFKGYKENYKQSMIGGIFYTILFAIMYVDYEVYMNQMNNLQMIGMVMLFFLLILFLSLFNFFSLVAHYHLGALQLIKNAILFTILRPFRTFSTLICAAVLGFLTLRFGWLIFFGFGSLTAFVAFYNFYIAYNKIQEKVERMRQNEEASNNGSTQQDGEDLTLELPSSENKEKD